MVIAMDAKHVKILSTLEKIIPACVMAAVVIWAAVNRKHLTMAYILSYTPLRPLLAVLVLWLMFAIKSMSVFFPIYVLYAASGVLFPTPWAIVVNCVGTAIALAVPYWVGYATGSDLVDRLCARCHALEHLKHMPPRRDFTTALLVRVIGVLPCDLVSLFFGATRMRFLPSVLGGTLGLLPWLVAVTLLGGILHMPDSPIASAVLCTAGGLAVVGLFILGARLLRLRKQSKTQKEQQPDTDA